MVKIEEDIIEVINKILEKDEGDVIVLPMGRWGKFGKQIFEEQGKFPIYCIDNVIYNDVDIFPMINLPPIKQKVTYVLLTQRDEVKRELVRQLAKIEENPTIVDVFEIIKEKSFARELQKINAEKRVKLDFLGVGFSKCGTSSLHTLLENHPHIFVPEIKENQFLGRVSEEGHKFLKKSYPFSDINGKCVGAIEPTYYNKAVEVVNYFGEDLKIIFCLRNPVRALFSYYKMMMRMVDNRTLSFIEIRKEVSMDFFEEWAAPVIQRFKYIDYIKEYARYYSKDKVLILFSEVMYQEPQKTIDEVQNFLGIDSSKWQTCEVFPHVNEGSCVAKDYFSAKINNCMTNYLFDNFNINIEQRKTINEIIENINLLTTKEYKENLSQELYNKLMTEYMQSILELEEFVGVNLKGIWY